MVYLSSALSLAERSLQIREKTFGPDHPDVAWSISEVGRDLHYLGDEPGARKMWERALAIREKAYGPNHPVVALGLENMAQSYLSTLDPASARPLAERALAIRQKVFGEHHPAYARSLEVGGRRGVRGQGRTPPLASARQALAVYLDGDAHRFPGARAPC
jgi:hypothetical protein